MLIADLLKNVFVLEEFLFQHEKVLFANCNQSLQNHGVFTEVFEFLHVSSQISA